MKTRDYTVILKSDRDVDHKLDIEAENENEAYKIAFGIDSGYGFPSDVDIVEVSEEHEPTADYLDWKNS